MKIELHNVRAFIRDATDVEHEWINDYLSWADDKAHFMRQRGYRTPSHIRLYTRVDDSYPAGFTRMLAKAAKDKGYVVQVVDCRTVPTTTRLPIPSGLRDYQVSTVTESDKRTRGIVWAATGAGKTQVAMGLVESIPVRWGFIVNQTQLGLQARDRYRSFLGMEAGVIAEGQWLPASGAHSMTVATFQSLHARLKGPDRESAVRWLESLDGIIVDECHVLPADSFRGVLDYTLNAYWRVGLSATPLSRGDRKSMHLIGCLGSVITRISAKTLIDAGVLARPIIRLVAHTQTSDKATWQGAYNEIVVNSKTRNALVCQLAVKAVKPTIVFVKALDQGKLVTKQLAKAGHKVEYVDGTTLTPIRQAAVTRLERGDTDILVSTVVMNQGIDVPELRSMVIAAGGSSTIMALQRVGRGMRRVPGKETFEVWDIDDRGNKWTKRHTKERIASYEVEEYEVEIVETV